MKTIQRILLLSVLFSSAIYSIPTKTITINTTESRKTYQHTIFSSSGPAIYYGSNSSFDIGQHYENPAFEDAATRIYVSGYYFSLSQLPPEEYIVSCNLRIILEDAEGGSFTAHVKQLPTTVFTNDSEETFNEIYDATKLFEFDYPDTSNYNIKSNVIANISDNFIKFGVSQNPNTYYSVSKRANIKSIQIIVKYYEYYNLEAKNNMGSYEGGDINVGKNNPIGLEDSPFPFTAKETDNINLEAVENQYNNEYYWIWNDEAETPLNKSEWKKYKDGVFSPISPSQSATYEVELYDDDADLIGYLKKVCNVAVNHNFDELGIIENDISNSTIVDGNFITVTAPPTKASPSGITGVFGGWEGTVSSSNPLSAVVTEHTNFTAQYKAIGYSNNPATYNKNNQRKFVRSTNGSLWNLYESIGSTWLERSSDNGNTWDLAKISQTTPPNTTSIFTDSNMKNASICISPDGDEIAIAYQKYDEYEEKNRISIELYQIGATNLLDFVSSYTIEGDAYGNDYLANSVATPVISSGSLSGIEVYHVAWVGSNGTESGIYYSCFDQSMDMLGGVTKIPNTNSSSQNPTIASKNNDVDLLAHLAWQQGWSYIQYSRIGVYSGWSGYFNFVDNFATISTGNGFPINYYPSITTSSSGYPIVAWVGSNYYNSSYTKIIRRMKSSTVWSSNFAQYGSNTPLYPQINMAGSAYVVAWTENNGAVKFIKPWGGVITFGTSGRYIQLANSTNVNSMYGSVLNTTSSPYPFTTTTSVGSTYKVNAASFNQGRGVVASVDTTQFFFIMGDVSCNGENIGFEELSDTLIIDKKKELDDYLLTEAFQFGNTDVLALFLYIGVSDSVSANSIIGKNKKVNFSFELIEDGTNKVLGKYENFVHKKGAIIKDETKSYKISGEGIGNKSVRLKLVLDTNIDGSYTLLDVRDNQKVLAKANASDAAVISYSGDLEISDYALLQNYPNPFNPSTTVKYQIPNDGMVSLRIYDITGQEVKTLVNQAQIKGRYEVNFDASNLSSGVYFYRLNSGNFTKSMKMLLLK